MHGGTIVLAESLDDIETAYQEAVAGRPATLPFADICIPSVFDPTARARGQARRQRVHPVGAAHLRRRSRTPDELEAYADRLVARMEAVAPGFTDSVIGRQVIGPHDDGARSTAWSAATSSTAS